MTHRRHRLALGCAMALAACAAAPISPALAHLLAEAPEDSTARLWIEGDHLVGAAVGLGPGSLPAAVRTTIDAVAPRGEMRFQGREWGPRGTGYRIDKYYAAEVIPGGAHEHTRSALVAPNGDVLERSHSVPLAKAPGSVLAAALQVGPHVEEVRIVSGPLREEYWECTVRDRIGRTFVATIGLDGRLLRTVRRVPARIDV